jgi:hypothetical protein
MCILKTRKRFEVLLRIPTFKKKQLFMTELPHSAGQNASLLWN